MKKLIISMAETFLSFGSALILIGLLFYGFKGLTLSDKDVRKHISSETSQWSFLRGYRNIQKSEVAIRKEIKEYRINRLTTMSVGIIILIIMMFFPFLIAKIREEQSNRTNNLLLFMKSKREIK